jgi:hypothetical protein
VKISSLFSLMILVSGTVFAGGFSVGNGGDGVRANNGKIYLLDLFENGLHLNPGVYPHPYSDEWRNPVFTPQFSPLLQRRLQDKFNEIAEQDEFFRLLLNIELNELKWQFVDVDAYPLSDAETFVDPSRLVQLAIRKDKTVRIIKKAFDDKDPDSLDLGNQVALIFHELIYSLTARQGDATSDRARAATADLFRQPIRVDLAADKVLGPVLLEEGYSEYGVGCSAHFGNPFYRDLETQVCSVKCANGRHPALKPHQTLSNENIDFHFSLNGSVGTCSWSESEHHRKKWQKDCPTGMCRSGWARVRCELSCDL